MILTKPARTFSIRSHTPGLAHVGMFVTEKVTLFGSEFCHLFPLLRSFNHLCGFLLLSQPQAI